MARGPVNGDFIQSKQRLVESNIVSGVSQKLLSEGTERYSSWGDHYRWTDESYNHRGSCAVYFQHFLYKKYLSSAIQKHGYLVTSLRRV